MLLKKLLLAGAFGLITFSILFFSSVKAAGECEYFTDQIGDTVTTTITFEYECQLREYPSVGGANFLDGWTTLLDSDAAPGARGNFANEPSPETVAWWYLTPSYPPYYREVSFDQPVSAVSLYYASYGTTVTIYAYGPDGNLIATSPVGQPNFGQGYPPGDPTGNYNKWDLLGVDVGENLIAKVRVTGWRYSALFDNFTFERKVPQLPDLFITKTDSIQVISNPDINGDGKIDLVQNKPVAVRVTVEAENADLINPSQPIEIKLDFDGRVSQSVTKTINQLLSGPVDFFLTPDVVGDYTVSATVDHQNLVPESDEGNNVSNLIVTVKDTRELYIAHILVDLNGTPVNFVETANSGANFLLGAYPLAPAEFTSMVFSNTFSSSRNLALDAILTWLYGKILSGGQADRIVNVVSKEYFEFYTDCNYPNIPVGLTLGNPILGITFPAVFTLDGFWTAEAHEIGHTFGLGEEYQVERTDTCGFDIIKEGEPASGYWVESPNGEEHYRSTLGFMGTSPGANSFDRWASRNSFVQLFRKFRINKDDPEVLLISGLVSLDGDIELQPLYRLPSGVVDVVEPGDFNLQMLNASGNVVFEQSFGVATVAFSESFPAITLENSAFAFAVPYSGEVAELIITKGEEVLRVNVTTRLLHDALDHIPDFGFINNATQRRNALHNKVRALENQVSARGDLGGVIRKLKTDIKPTIMRWLIERYEVENPLQYSKEEILELVDRLIERTQNQL